MPETMPAARLRAIRMNAALLNHPWVCGDMFTLADISLTPTIVRMEDLHLEHLWSDLPTIADWFERIQNRPSFAQAYEFPARDIHREGKC